MISLEELNKTELDILNYVWEHTSDDVRKLFYNNLGDNFINNQNN